MPEAIDLLDEQHAEEVCEGHLEHLGESLVQQRGRFDQLLQEIRDKQCARIERQDRARSPEEECILRSSCMT